MNVLPLILALALVLTVLTVEKLEKFKNQITVQKEYQTFLQENERYVFNQRQKNLYGDSQKSHRQLSFRYLLDKQLREGDKDTADQYRLLILKLMEIVYGEATFFKKLKDKRSNFLEEMLIAIEKAADKVPNKTIRRIRDIARLKLEDPELQKAFYHMLKGTIERDQLEQMQPLDEEMRKKAYVSLFTFVEYAASKKIKIQLAPREILKAIFDKDEVVEAIMNKRNELSADKNAGSAPDFAKQFKDERCQGIKDTLLDFSISSSDKTGYN